VNVRVDRNKDGIWCARAYLGTDHLTGLQRRPYKTFPEARTEAEAKAAANAWIESLADGTIVDQLESYVDTKEANGAAKNTIRQYRGFIKNHVERLMPYEIPAQITPAEITSFEGRLLRGDSSHKPLARSTVVAMHWFLQGGFRFMRTTLKTIKNNPMSDVAHPKRDRLEAIALDEADFAKLNRWIEQGLQDKEHLQFRAQVFAVWLGINTGMRVGEVCAVRRRDFSCARKMISVSGTVIEIREVERQDKPKTVSSRRNISVTKDVADRIIDFERWQDATFGPLTPNNPIATWDGNYLRPSQLSSWFTQQARQLGLPKGTSFHTLRHTHATFLILSGADIKTVQERLGHESSTTTLDLYGHVLPGRDQAAAEAFEMLAKEVR
jgi:integrase